MQKFKLFIAGVVLSLLFHLPAEGRNAVIQDHSPDSLRIIEKVYLHVDRGVYYPGDTIWFKAYLIDAIDRSLSPNSGNLHVELISPASKIISIRIIKLTDGLGNGDFTLPNEIKSGKYVLRAYTNYMRNYGDQSVFSKDITVINSSDEKNDISEKVNYAEKKIQITFFPEGGSLVDNVSSIVAFKAVNNLGKGCDISGKIYNSSGDLITSFNSTHLGMGSFYLRPLPGVRYFSVFRGEDSIDIKTDLPLSFPTGVVLGVSLNENNELLITTKTNPKTLQLVLEHELLLSFSVRKEVIKSIKYKITYPVTNFVIPVYDLPDGVVLVSLSASNDLPLSERLVYIPGKSNLGIHIKTDKLSYNRREPVSVSISLSGDTILEKAANVSLAAVDTRLTGNSSQYPGNISSWFLLESDVRGYIEEPSYYFDVFNQERFRDLDLLLRTQGWRDFAWKYDTTYFAPEKGFNLSGRLRRLHSDKSIIDSKVSVGIFEKGDTYLTTVPVDSSGRFILHGLDITGEAKVVASGIGKKDDFQGLMTLDSLAAYRPLELPDEPALISGLSENSFSELKTSYEIIEAMKKKYRLSDTIDLGTVNIISGLHKDIQTIKVESSRLKYGTPDHEIIVTKPMESYPYLIEILRGRVPGLVVSNNPKYAVRIRTAATFKGTGEPLVLVDGHQASFDELVMMPINFVDRIDVLKSGGNLAIFGVQGSNGVINIITKAGGPANNKQVSYTASLKMSGYNAARVFYSPIYPPDVRSSAQPDIRSTLFWEPDINLEGDEETIMNFYNGDNPSKIKITAEGITSTGIPVTGNAEFEMR